jgi:hypothetical protein
VNLTLVDGATQSRRNDEVMPGVVARVGPRSAGIGIVALKVAVNNEMKVLRHRWHHRQALPISGSVARSSPKRRRQRPKTVVRAGTCDVLRRI